MYAKAVVAANAFSKYTHTEWRRRRRKERQPLAQYLNVWGMRIWKKPFTYLLKNELWIFALKINSSFTVISKNVAKLIQILARKFKDFWSFFHSMHSVWKSQKKSHSSLRAKRATFTFWVDKSLLKMPKMVNFGEFLKPETCGQTVLPDRSAF